jgi:hypothetical protein
MATVLLPAAILVLGIAAGVGLLRVILSEVATVRVADQGPDDTGPATPPPEGTAFADITTDEPRLLLD